MGPVSQTREQYLESIRGQRGLAVSFGELFTLTQLTWQPGGGERWSALECLDHLTVFNELYLSAMDTASGNAGPGRNAGLFRAGLPSAKFIELAGPPAKMKLKAPGKIQPRPTLNPEKIIPDYLRTLDRVIAFVESTAGKDLNRVRFRNPFIPLIRFTVGTGLLVLDAHSRRHLWQAQRVFDEPGFPPSES